MEKAVIGIKIVFAAAGAFLGRLVGGMDGLLKVLLLFVVLDYLSGVAVAITEKQLSSAVGFKGIAKKVFIFALVSVGYAIDVHIIGTGTALRTAVCMFYLANEGLSVMENTTKMGLPLPPKVKDVLLQIKGKEENV